MAVKVARWGTCQRILAAALHCCTEKRLELSSRASKTVGTVLLSRSHRRLGWHQVQKCDWGARARCKHLPPALMRTVRLKAIHLGTFFKLQALSTKFLCLCYSNKVLKLEKWIFKVKGEIVRNKIITSDE